MDGSGGAPAAWGEAERGRPSQGSTLPLNGQVAGPLSSELSRPVVLNWGLLCHHSHQGVLFVVIIWGCYQHLVGRGQGSNRMLYCAQDSAPLPAPRWDDLIKNVNRVEFGLDSGTAILKVWSPDLVNQCHLKAYQQDKFWSLTSDLLNHMLWQQPVFECTFQRI